MVGRALAQERKLASLLNNSKHAGYNTKHAERTVYYRAADAKDDSRYL